MFIKVKSDLQETIDELNNFVTSKYEPNEVFVYNNFAEFVKEQEEVNPYVVIVDLDSESTDIMDYIKSIDVKDEKYVFISSHSNPKLLQVLKEEYNIEIEEHASLEEITKNMITINLKDNTPSNHVEKVEPFKIASSYEDRRDMTLNERIANIFMVMGVPPHIRGYQYLRESVKLAVERPSIINEITKGLYPKVAEKFETTPTKVERAIRHAITVTWARGKSDPSRNIFGMPIASLKRRPTNGELIALISDRILVDSSRDDYLIPRMK